MEYASPAINRMLIDTHNVRKRDQSKFNKKWIVCKLEWCFGGCILRNVWLMEEVLIIVNFRPLRELKKCWIKLGVKLRRFEGDFMCTQFQSMILVAVISSQFVDKKQSQLIEQKSMDHRVQEVMTESMENTAGKLRELEPFMTKKMQQVIERCFSSNASSSGKFAECAMSNTKKIEEVTKGIEFKLVFFSKFANNCLMTKDVNNCKEETTRELSKMVDNVRNEIERI